MKLTWSDSSTPSKKTRVWMAAGAAMALTLSGCAGGQAGVDSDGEPSAADYSLFENPIPVLIPQSDGSVIEGTFTPPQPVEEDYHICVSLPTMADAYWIAGAYGLATEAERLGVRLTILNAGSYANLSTQVGHITDCASQNADAVLVAPISVDGVAPVIRSLEEAGIPVVNIVPRIPSDDLVSAKATIDYYDLGRLSAERILEEIGVDAPAKVAIFPGPAGADWAAKTAAGFQDAIEGSAIEVVDVKFGDIVKDVQLNLINDTLSRTPDIDWIIAEAAGADAAVEATASHGSKAQIGSIGTYPAVRQQLVDGKVAFCMVDNVVWMASMGVDLAVKLLNGDKLDATEIWPVPGVLTAENAFDEPSAGFAPEGYQPVFEVRP